MTEPGLHFDRVASTYRHARPGYPDAVYDLLAAHGAIGPGLRVLEIGAGAGQATAELLRRGCVVDAVEPGPALAETLRVRFAGAALTVMETTAEAADLAEASYDAVLAATSLHWVDTEPVLPRLHAALRPGGRLGIWWAVFRDPESRTPFRARMDEIARRHGREDDSVPRPLRVAERVSELEAGGLFGDVEAHIVRWSHALTPAAARALFTTFPTWADDPVLLDEVEGAVRACGGNVVEEYLCAVYLGRRT